MLLHCFQLIAMNAEEADAQGIEDMASLESAMPGLAQAVKTFFTVYKVFSLPLSVSYIAPSAGSSRRWREQVCIRW